MLDDEIGQSSHRYCAALFSAWGWIRRSSKSSDETFEFVVIRMFQHFVVHVADEMNQAFLLKAANGIVSSIKIRHEDARKIFDISCMVSSARVAV